MSVNPTPASRCWHFTVVAEAGMAISDNKRETKDACMAHRPGSQVATGGGAFRVAGRASLSNAAEVQQEKEQPMAAHADSTIGLCDG